MWLRLAFVLVVATVGSGCVNKFRTDSHSPPTRAISSAEKALILTSENGRYDGKSYANSGNALASQVEIAVLSHLSQATVVAGNDLAAALVQARANAIDFVLEPKI